MKRKIIESSDDEDYIPSSSSSEEEEEEKIKKKYINILKNNIFLKKYTYEELEYYNKLPKKEKDNIKNIELSLNNNNLNKEPLRFKLLKINTTLMNKKVLMNKFDELSNMDSNNGDYYKLYNWINTASKIPLGKYTNLPINYNNSIIDISNYLNDIKKKLNDSIYGHHETKEQIIRILSQLVSYPNAKALVIGIQGAMGIGKTDLIKKGIAEALNMTFSFIPLGGISEASFLKGHSYTYEGSRHGKIIESLIKSQSLNNIFYFDELDKVSESKAGEEIINTLIHITDSTQNDKFNDRYFEELDIDLSKCLIIFSYNDEYKINPILKDRMITINAKGYKQHEKIIITRDYLMKNILNEYNIKNNDIILNDDIIKYIIELTINEDGVRSLQRNLNKLISYINLYKYIPTDDFIINFPYTITKKFVDKHIQKIENDFKLSLYL